jgi:hypothetical protein
MCTVVGWYDEREVAHQRALGVRAGRLGQSIVLLQSIVTPSDGLVALAQIGIALANRLVSLTEIGVSLANRLVPLTEIGVSLANRLVPLPEIGVSLSARGGQARQRIVALSKDCG